MLISAETFLKYYFYRWHISSTRGQIRTHTLGNFRNISSISFEIYNSICTPMILCCSSTSGKPRPLISIFVHLKCKHNFICTNVHTQTSILFARVRFYVLFQLCIPVNSCTSASKCVTCCISFTYKIFPHNVFCGIVTS